MANPPIDISNFYYYIIIIIINVGKVLEVMGCCSSGTSGCTVKARGTGLDSVITKIFFSHFAFAILSRPLSEKVLI